VDLAGRVVAVTGGTRGIGRAIVDALVARDARVAVGDLEPGARQSRVDVRDEESFRSFVDTVERDLGPLDVLVNNAGVAVPGRLVDTTAAEQDLQLAVNLHGVLHGLRCVVPGMLARGRGHVVSIASAAGRIPAPRAAVYSASKHAVVGLSEAVRSELLGTGVRVTAVLPAVVRTQMSDGLRLRGLPAVPPERVARAVVRILTGRSNPATVFVPWWVGPLALADIVSPRWLRDAARRFSAVAPGDEAERTDYLDRIARQLSRP
jgi:NAD(P)-dependent dehydrogenase (short-subunit alcohol dehydrogenase family)